MAPRTAENIRNIAFCGHGHSGKTNLLDHILHKTGAVGHLGSVVDGTSVCDFDDIEKQHKYTIESAVTHFEHGGRSFQAIDTPGYPDFLGQTIAALRAVETVVLVVDAHSGVGVNTRRVFQEAGKLGLGRMIVLAKMDADNIDYPALVDSIQSAWGPACIPLNVPIGVGGDFKGVVSVINPAGDTGGALIDPASIHDGLIEAIVEVDEGATERYFEGQEPTGDELVELVDRSIAAGSLIPIVCVSAKTDTGVSELLDCLSICDLPPDAVSRTAKDAASGEERDVKADPSGPLVAQVFKTRIDPFVQKLSFIRVFSGTLAKDSTVHNFATGKPIKVGQLLRIQGAHTEPVDSAGPGEIVALAKMEDLHTGTSLGDLKMPPISLPSSMVGLAVTPKSRGDEAKLSGALQKVVEEDPTFRLDRDPQTKELVMTGMSELHLQIVQERLKLRDKVEVQTKEPKIPYRETIQAEAEGSYRHKKQSGGRGQFGEVHIRMYPLPNDVNIEEWANKGRFPSMRDYHYDEANNFLWVDSIVGGTIPNNFLPAVEKGFKERLAKGVIAGHQIQNVCVEVHFGKHHPVDSSEAAFKTAGSMAFRNVFQTARPGLLEPIVKMDITVPGDNVGDISSDMSGRRGRMLGMDSAGGGMQTISVEVPLAEVTTYARSLSSITGGQGSYTIEFSHYDVVPGNVQKEIVEKATLHEDEDES
jgi:elongation factor G